MRDETTQTSKIEIPGSSGAPAVELNQIARRFGDRWALRGISLRVEEGEVLALLGRNGSGKTTLLRILSTALRPTRGSGRVLGHDLLRDRDSIRGEIGFLGHSPGLYGDLTARENLRFALRMLGQTPSPSLIYSALETVGLEGEADVRIRGFSAGMQRRLALARVLLQRPRLLLLDEPYASFDPTGIEFINSYLAEHRASGGTAIIATHDLTRASGVLDRVYELHRGRELEIAGDRVG